MPQSAQNLALAGVSAPQLGQHIGSGLPQSAQKGLPAKLSVPHLEQRILLAQLVHQPVSSVAQALACDVLNQRPSMSHPDERQDRA